MNLKLRKYMTYFAIAMYFMFAGVEYAVIIPTVPTYVTVTLGASQGFYGLVMSAYSLTALISNPIMGWLSDSYFSTKWLFLASNLFQIAGSFMYFMGGTSGYGGKWMVLAGRLVAGLGTGAGSSILGDISKATPAEEKTKVFSVIMVMRQLGIIVGPAFNLFLVKASGKLGPWEVTAETIPGLFMAAAWILIEITTLVFYTDILDLEEETMVERQAAITEARRRSTLQESMKAYHENRRQSTLDRNMRRTSVNAEYVVRKSIADPRAIGRTLSLTDLAIGSPLGPNYYVAAQENTSYVETALGLPSLAEKQEYEEIQSDDGAAADDDVFSNDDDNNPTESTPLVNGAKTSTSSFFYDAFVKEEVIATLTIIFCTSFDQAALETLFTPLANYYLAWGEKSVSLFFMSLGVLSALIFFALRVISRWLNDYQLIILGLLCLILSMGVTLLMPIFNYLPCDVFNDKTCVNDIKLSDPDWFSSGHYIFNFAILVGSVLLNVCGLPPLVVCGTSLFSKTLPDEVQGIAQGIRRSTTYLAMIVGPLICGALLGTKTEIILNFSLLGGVFLLVTVMQIASKSTLMKYAIVQADGQQPAMH